MLALFRPGCDRSPLRSVNYSLASGAGRRGTGHDAPRCLGPRPPGPCARSARCGDNCSGPRPRSPPCWASRRKRTARGIPAGGQCPSCGWPRPGPWRPAKIPTGCGLWRRQSELCATCHTLTTEAFDADGNVVGSLPEQVPYQEWQHSAFVAEEVGCQSCHMPAVGTRRRSRRAKKTIRDGVRPASCVFR